MQATPTFKGQITLPVSIRRKLGLEAGDVLEFDKTVPYMMARKPFDRGHMRRAIGRGKSRKSARGSKAHGSRNYAAGGAAMITVVDTSALVAIDLGEPDAEGWIECLANARERGGLIICDVVADEFYPFVLHRPSFEETLRDPGIRPVTTTLETACVAGAAFRKYRDAGGLQEHLVSDLLIAAQAVTDCDALAAADRGYLRRYFRGLWVIGPGW